MFFQEGDFQSETIRFGTERMTIDSWVRKRTYDAFREFVGSGMNYHLQVPVRKVQSAKIFIRTVAKKIRLHCCHQYYTICRI